MVPAMMVPLPTSLLSRVKAMDQNFFYIGLSAIFIVISGFRFCATMNNRSYGMNSCGYNQSQTNFDFNMIFYLLVAGVIGMFVWLVMGGLKTEIKAPAVAQSSSSAASYSSTNFATASLVGRGLPSRGSAFRRLMMQRY